MQKAFLFAFQVAVVAGAEADEMVAQMAFQFAPFVCAPINLTPI